MKKQYGFYLDADNCIGCNACVIACRDKNNLTSAMLWRRTYEIQDRIDIPAFYTSMSCNHCQNPSCVKACTVGALEKRETDGLVAVNAEKCKGCRKCIKSCPYGSLYMNEASSIIFKCDGCLDLLGSGEAPACISACPMRVIEFGPLIELKGKHSDAVPIDQVLHINNVNMPSFIVKSQRNEHKK